MPLDNAPKKVTMLHVRKALAAAFPNVAFTFGEAGRGHNRGPCVSWEGGPSATDVWAAAPHLSWTWRKPRHLHLNRIMTPEEAQAYHAAEEERREAERPAREAAEKARRIAAKANGIARAAETRRRTAALTDALARAFPDAAFKLRNEGGWYSAVWTGGPSEDNVIAVAERLGLNRYNCTRYLSETETAERDAVIAQIRQRKPAYFIRHHDSTAYLRTELRDMIREERKAERQARPFANLRTAKPLPYSRPYPKPQLRLPLSLPSFMPAALRDGRYPKPARTR